MRELALPRLAERTTIRLGGHALAELTLECREDALRVPERLTALGGQMLVLGAGSNILAQDGELPLVLVRCGLTDGPEIVEDSGEHVLVRAGAAVPLPRLLRFCAANGLGGLEGLTGIPGSVGGAIAMNAGSFGCETCARLERATVFDGLCLREFTRDMFCYGYRHTLFAGKSSGFMVLDGTFSLTRVARDGIAIIMRRNFLKKKSRQPVTAWSAGCVFKNPAPDVSAGKLLDAAGFRGKSLGGMAFSSLHANFLINEGRGTAAAAFALLDMAREAVARKFGITLETEVRILACPF